MSALLAHARESARQWLGVSVPREVGRGVATHGSGGSARFGHAIGSRLSGFPSLAILVSIHVTGGTSRIQDFGVGPSRDPPWVASG